MEAASCGSYRGWRFLTGGHRRNRRAPPPITWSMPSARRATRRSGGLAAAEPSLRAAVRQLHLSRDATQARRKRRLLKLQQLETSLLPLSDELRRDFSPAHMQMREDGAPRLHSAWLACIARAFHLDARIGVDAVLGFTPVGRVPASGAFDDLTRGQVLPFVSTLDGPMADRSRWRAIAALAEEVVQGRTIRLACVCFPRQCHATSVAAAVRTHAMALLRASDGGPSKRQSAENIKWLILCRFILSDLLVCSGKRYCGRGHLLVLC